MTRRALLVAPGVLVAMAASSATAGPRRAGPLAGETALESKAIAVLKAFSARLAAARTLSFTAVAAYESPSRLGPARVYTTKSAVTVQRPNSLKVVTTGDGPAPEFYYDGKTMMAFSPAEGLVAVAEAPPTIDAALEAAYHSVAIYFPFTDAIVADPYADIARVLAHSGRPGAGQLANRPGSESVGGGFDCAPGPDGSGSRVERHRSRKAAKGTVVDGGRGCLPSAGHYRLQPLDRW